MTLQAAAGLFGRCAMAEAGGGGAWDDLFGGGEGMEGFDVGDWDADASMLLPHGWFQQPDIVAPTAAAPQLVNEFTGGVGFADAVGGRRKRRRTTKVKNSEEVASQRMNHIAVERNRRQQMNQYLAALRFLMPPSYSQRGDQASIIGGAINFVKELEQRVQSLETHKRSRRCVANYGEATPPPFSNFFTFPQYSMSAAATSEPARTRSKQSVVADVEVTMVEAYANLRVLSRRRPMQLLRLVVALQGHRLTVVHLNINSAGHMVLYSLILKVENYCQVASVDEIATAAHQVLEKIQEEEEPVA